ncbi:MAG: glycoside hydrolase 43 family protein [Crocinitomicaceae bacterium]|nr:glycoside hydrolase 43 family protein [Crocinitomicaceae bacterium]|tara:strand:- start:2258 stop:3937 length:1680 start_codon:yes stop_codon:yes gene_type:complete
MKKLLFGILMWFSAFSIMGQQEHFNNPILRGGYPDPSICRVGNDYYLVNSSFEYFPGLPIHHSTDLVNWELVGHGLHRKSQCTGTMNLVDVQSNGGIHAPTIRYHDSTFYIITTNVYQPPNKDEPTQFINFIITAKHPEGPWSDPIIIKGAPGIDPDIFFDDGGKIWYSGTHAPDKPNFQGEGEIWMQELDPTSFQLLGERHYLWRGACQGTWAEGPHIYKKDGWYYLLIAEGGTHFNHAVMVAASKNITGPYEPNDRNPIFTTRHMSYDYWVNSTGHADIIELPNGEWKMVCLGIRNEVNRGSNMGRETMLIPITWEQEPYDWKEVKYTWPVCAPLTGKLEQNQPYPLARNTKYNNAYFQDDFNNDELGMHWTSRRVPKENAIDLNLQPGFLRMKYLPQTIVERKAYNFLGIKQQESQFELVTSMQFNNKLNGEEAGFCLIQKDDNYILFDVKREDNENVLQLVIKPHDKEAYIKKDLVLNKKTKQLELKITANKEHYNYYYRLKSNDIWINFDQTSNDVLISRGYTGAHLGLYATCNGGKSVSSAAFELMTYKNIIP